MRLTRSDFVEICGALSRQQAAGDARRGSDQRGAARMAVERGVTVTVLGPDGKPGEPFTAVTRDISYAGLGLLSRQSLRHNTLLVVRLPRKDKEPLAMLCRAVHVRELAEGVYAIGAEFVKEA